VHQSLSPSALLSSEQLKETFQDETKTDNGAREVEKKVEDCEEVLDLDNCSSVLITVLITINNKCEHECLDEAVRLLNSRPIHQMIANWVPRNMYSIPVLPGTNLCNMVHCEEMGLGSDIPGALVADEMGLGKTFTLVAVAMIGKLPTKKVVMGFLLSILWGNTLEVRLNMAQNDYPGIIGEDLRWYPLQRLNSVPRHLLEILTTPPPGNAALASAHEPILVVTIPGVTETFQIVIDEMTSGTDFTLVDFFHGENVNLTHDDLNATIDKPEHRCNIHLLSYDNLTSRAQPSSHGQLSYCGLCVGIFDESHQYKTEHSRLNTVGWQIPMIARIVFNLQVTATLGFHSLYDWCFQTMWVISGAPEDPEDDTLMERHGAEELY